MRSLAAVIAVLAPLVGPEPAQGARPTPDPAPEPVPGDACSWIRTDTNEDLGWVIAADYYRDNQHLLSCTGGCPVLTASCESSVGLSYATCTCPSLEPIPDDPSATDSTVCG